MSQPISVQDNVCEQRAWYPCDVPREKNGGNRKKVPKRFVHRNGISVPLQRRMRQLFITNN